MLARFLKVGSRIRLRIRRLSGVTSRSSSTSMKSSACSRLKILGGTRVNASSAEEERVLVRCFFLQTFNSISSALEARTDDHTGVYLFAWSNKQSTAILCGEQTVGDGLAGLKCDQGTELTVSDIALVRCHSR